MNKVAVKIVDWLIQEETIESSRRSIYELGICQLLTYILDVFGILILGILFFFENVRFFFNDITGNV